MNMPCVFALPENLLPGDMIDWHPYGFAMIIGVRITEKFVYTSILFHEHPVSEASWSRNSKTIEVTERYDVEKR